MNWIDLVRERRNSLNDAIVVSRGRVCISVRGCGEQCTKSDINTVIESFGGMCAYCGKPYEHMDHIVPVAKGGTAGINNLIPACARCNRSKRVHDMETWYRNQDSFDVGRLELIQSHMSVTE